MGDAVLVLVLQLFTSDQSFLPHGGKIWSPL